MRDVAFAVNFLGPCDEYITSGSDDGNFFIWKKSTGDLVDVLEGDGSVVNVIEGHPTLPLVAVSGIDTTIKVIFVQIYYHDYAVEHVVTVVCPCSRPGDIFQISKCPLDHEAECTCFEKGQPHDGSTVCAFRYAASCSRTGDTAGCG